TAELLPAASAAEAVRDADVICAATTSVTPVVAGRELKPGAHVNGVGSYTTEMQEGDEETGRRAGTGFGDCRSAALAGGGAVGVGGGGRCGDCATPGSDPRGGLDRVGRGGRRTASGPVCGRRRHVFQERRRRGAGRGRRRGGGAARERVGAGD